MALYKCSIAIIDALLQCDNSYKNRRLW